MDKVYIIVCHFSDSNTHESSSNIVCAVCSKVNAEKAVSKLKQSHFGSRYEIVETDLYE